MLNAVVALEDAGAEVRLPAQLAGWLRTAPATDIAGSPWFTLGRVQAACLLGDDPAPHVAVAQRVLDRVATAPPTPGTWSLEDVYGAPVLDATLPEDPCRPGWWTGMPAV